LNIQGDFPAEVPTHRDNGVKGGVRENAGCEWEERDAGFDGGVAQVRGLAGGNRESEMDAAGIGRERLEAGGEEELFAEGVGLRRSGFDIDGGELGAKFGEVNAKEFEGWVAKSDAWPAGSLEEELLDVGGIQLPADFEGVGGQAGLIGCGLEIDENLIGSKRFSFESAGIEWDWAFQGGARWDEEFFVGAIDREWQESEALTLGIDDPELEIIGPDDALRGVGGVADRKLERAGLERFEPRGAGEVKFELPLGAALRALGEIIGDADDVELDGRCAGGVAPKREFGWDLRALLREHTGVTAFELIGAAFLELNPIADPGLEVGRLVGLQDLSLGEHVSKGLGGRDREKRFAGRGDIQPTVESATTFPHEGNRFAADMGEAPVERCVITDDMGFGGMDHEFDFNGGGGRLAQANR
jgi:hypothetical protein